MFLNSLADTGGNIRTKLACREDGLFFTWLMLQLYCIFLYILVSPALEIIFIYLFPGRCLCINNEAREVARKRDNFFVSSRSCCIIAVSYDCVAETAKMMPEFVYEL